MKLMALKIPDVVLIELDINQDDRGWFMENYNYLGLAKAFKELGIAAPEKFVQDNHSFSRQGVLRGLHYQRTKPQGKLLRVTHGEAFDVVVDLRRASPTFGQWIGITLSGDKPEMLWVPPGMAHGFYARTDVEVQYKCSEYYLPDDEACLQWNDLTLAIEWPLNDAPVLSEKDRKGMSWSEATHS